MRGSGRYGDSGSGTHPHAQMQHMSGQRMDHKPVNYHGRPDPMVSEKEHPYGASKAEGQWRWERDGSKAPSPMSSHMFNQGQGSDDSRSYYQGQRADAKGSLDRQGNKDPLSVPHGEAMNVGYENNPLPQNFEGLDKRFLDDIMKLSKEQNDAEDAENARHRETLNTINIKYEEQLAALRARYAHRRNEFLQKESQAREKQYQQAIMDSYHGTGMAPNDPQPQGYANESRGNYNSNQYDSFREHEHFRGNNARDFEQRGQYPSRRAYDTGSRNY